MPYKPGGDRSPHQRLADIHRNSVRQTAMDLTQALGRMVARLDNPEVPNGNFTEMALRIDRGLAALAAMQDLLDDQAEQARYEREGPELMPFGLLAEEHRVVLTALVRDCDGTWSSGQRALWASREKTRRVLGQLTQLGLVTMEVPSEHSNRAVYTVNERGLATYRGAT